MKTILFLFALLIFGLVSCSTRNVAVQQAENQAEEGVVIDGVRWATRNVETPGTFARNPESAGRFFTFEEAQNACPPGWRLPTAEEFRNLRTAGSEWTAKGRRDRIYGYTFGIEPNLLFLPAAGSTATAPNQLYLRTAGYQISTAHHVSYSTPVTHNSMPAERHVVYSPAGARRVLHSTAGARHLGTHGLYWSSTANHTSIGWGLWFNSSSGGMSTNSRANRLSVRCVSSVGAPADADL